MDISRLSGNDLKIGKMLFTETKRSLNKCEKHILFANLTTTEHGIVLIMPRPVLLKSENGMVRIISNTTTQATLLTVTETSVEVLP